MLFYGEPEIRDGTLENMKPEGDPTKAVRAFLLCPRANYFVQVVLPTVDSQKGYLD